MKKASLLVNPRMFLVVPMLLLLICEPTYSNRIRNAPPKHRSLVFLWGSAESAVGGSVDARRAYLKTSVRHAVNQDVRNDKESLCSRNGKGALTQTTCKSLEIGSTPPAPAHTSQSPTKTCCNILPFMATVRSLLATPANIKRCQSCYPTTWPSIALLF